MMLPCAMFWQGNIIFNKVEKNLLFNYNTKQQ